MPTPSKKLKKVKTLGELYNLAQTDEGYRKLLFCANENLGGLKTDDPKKAIQWLTNTAMETGSEKGVVAEVNFCRDLV